LSNEANNVVIGLTKIYLLKVIESWVKLDIL